MYGVDGVLYIVAEASDSESQNIQVQCLVYHLVKRGCLASPNLRFFPVCDSHSMGYSHLIEELRGSSELVFVKCLELEQCLASG